MSQIEEEDASKPWTEHDLKEALRRINAGEINLKDAENYYGISPRTIHRQRAIENMRAQLNPEKARKMKSAGTSTSKKDVTILRKPVEISCSSISDIATLLNEGSEEVKQLLNHECDLIYECKVCKSLFRSFLNFISHKRIYCCDMYSVVHTQTDHNGDDAVTADPTKVEEKLKAKENLKEFTSRPFRITCRKDLTTVLKRIATLTSDLVPTEPILQLQTMENTTCALQQIIMPNQPNQLVDESTAKLPVPNPADENAPAICQEESKKENTVRSNEKTGVVTKPVTLVAEKRFKCPLCPSHCTTKKSVLRHLKSVHHKSDEQLERLKPRIQMFLVKKKNLLVSRKGAPAPSSKQSTSAAAALSSTICVRAKSPSVSSTSSSSENLTSPGSSTKNNQNSEKGDWKKECSLCGRHFVNRSSYASHTRVCRKNASSDGDAGSASSTSTASLLPIVSLTPIVTATHAFKNENCSNSPSKKLATIASHSKKVGLPLGTASSSSKRIGIQVRMNYCKEGVNQTNSINSTPVGHTSPSGLSQPSTDISRRSSVISVTRDEKIDISKMDSLNGHNTRSSSKLAHIVKSLLKKHGIKEENAESKNTEVVNENEVYIYCEDCKTTYPLNDHQWNWEDGTPRNYKCLLRDCDFRSSNTSELLSHLSAQHAVLSENELPEGNSIFVAESSGVPSMGAVKRCCHKKMSRERSLERRKRDTTEKSRLMSAQTAVPPKRKLNADMNNKSTKRKMVLQLKKKSVLPAADEKSGKTAIAASMDSNRSEVAKNDQLLKSKKTVSKEANGKPARVRTKKRVPLVDNLVIIPNGGLETSGDEHPQFGPARTITTQNPLSSETKVASRLPKLNTLMESTPFSLAPDTDLDLATKSEENLKKAVMTIIFGEGVSDENVDSNIVDTREKSPASSSASSDGGKEKRYGLRTATNKSIVTSLSESKDDKVLKVQILNKVKNVPR